MSHGSNKAPFYIDAALPFQLSAAARARSEGPDHRARHLPGTALYQRLTSEPRLEYMNAIT